MGGSTVYWMQLNCRGYEDHNHLRSISVATQVVEG